MSQLAGKLIAEGATAEIYLWDEGRVLKLFRDWTFPDWVDYEAKIARAVHSLGVPSPEVGEIVEVEGRRGLIYGRLEGPSMLAVIGKKPWRINGEAKTLAGLHGKIHSNPAPPELPSLHDRTKRSINQIKNFPEEKKKVLLDMLDKLPRGDRLCHNDFHPDNIILTADGPVAIDWMNASVGDPAADATRTSIIFRFGIILAKGKLFRMILKTGRKKFHDKYMKQFFRISGIGREEIERWEPVVAAARLAENYDEERESLLRIIDEGIARYRGGEL